MTIKDLIKALGQFDPEMPVLFASDEEGNIYHPKVDITLVKGVYEDDEEKLAVGIYPLNTEDDIR